MSNLRLELKWALILSLVFLLWAIVVRITGWDVVDVERASLYGLIVLIPMFIVFFFGIRQIREDDYDGNMTWMEGFKSGFIIALFAAIISPLVYLLQYNVIHPGLLEEQIHINVEYDHYGSAEDAKELFNHSTQAVINAITTFFSGLFISAIVCLFVKRT